MIFKSKKRAALALAALLLAALHSVKNIRLTRVAPSERENWTVEFEWFGMDAEKIEKLVSIPFEEKACKLEKLVSISSICENSKCVASLVFEKSQKSAYGALSDAAEELRKSLPQDAQNPRISALSQDSKFFFCAAFDKSLWTLDEIKSELLKNLSAVSGVSQALVSGGESAELQLAFDEKILDKSGLFPWDLATQAQESQAALMFGKKRFYKQEAASLRDIREIPLVKKSCKVQDSFQKKEAVVRVNGKECLLISLKSAEESQNISISKKCRKILKKSLKNRDGWEIIYDKGAEQEKALKKIILAFFDTLAALAAAVWLMFKSIKKTAASLAFTAADTLLTCAALAALGKPLDSATISGLTISLGLLCDAALYVLDDCETSNSTLTACALTTIAAIAPLSALNSIVPGIKQLGWTCALSIGLSCLLALIFLPVLAEQERKAQKTSKNFLKLSDFSYKQSRKIFRLSTFLYIIPLVLFIFLPKNLRSPDFEPVIYAQIECKPETCCEAVDRDAKTFAEEVLKIKGVKFVQTEAKRGRAEIQVVLDKAKRKGKTAKLLQEKGKDLAGFLYVPLAPPKRKIVQKIQAAVLGDDATLCKKIAKDAASLVQGQDSFWKQKGQVVLNFSEDETVFLAAPRKDFLRQNSLSVKDLALFLRWNLFGPVAAKIRSDGRQKDVRIGNERLAFSKEASLDDVKNLSLKSIPISALCEIKKTAAPARLFRKDCRRAAFFTIEAETKNSWKFFMDVKKAVEKINLPDGYYFSWPKEYESLRENYAKIFAAFLISAAAIFFLVAAQSQNAIEALCVLATIPLSLFLPLFLRAVSLRPISLGDAIGMVFVSGLCVNNALYILAEWKRKRGQNAFLSAQKLEKSVLSSSITTLISSIPVMLSGGSFAADLAFFMFFGSLASIFAGLVYFPAAITCAAKKTPRQKAGL